MIIDIDKKTRALRWAGLALLTLLFAVWPVQHTISVRDLLLVSATGIFGYLVWRTRPAAWWTGLEWPVAWYGALTLWLLAVAFLISHETAWSLEEIRGQWLKGALALGLGALAAAVFRQTEGGMDRCLTIVFFVLLLHALYVDARAILTLIEVRNNPDVLAVLTRAEGIAPGAEGYSHLALLRSLRWETDMLTHRPDKSNLLSNLVFYFLLAEIFLRLHGRRLLPVGNILVALSLIAVLYSIYIEGTRNGVIEIVVASAVFLFFFFRTNRNRMRLRWLAALAVMTALSLGIVGYISYKSDPRWQSLWQTVPIALDTEKHRAWLDLNGPVPELPTGEPVNRSNYMRIARIKAGIDLTLENPWGVGYGRNAFGHAVMKKYGVSSSHSHSGLIDMAIGTGIPGTFLWLAFLGSLGVVAARGYLRRGGYPSMLLLLVVSGFTVRMLLDSIVRDHMLQMFLFLAAFLAVAVVREPAGART